MFALLCFLSALSVYFLTELKMFRLIELKMLDYRFQLRGKTTISKDIVLVSIGERDIEILGRWPWPRKYHSDLIEILNSYGAKIIGYDILFCEPDKDDPESDACLATTLEESGNVCLPMAFGVEGKDRPDLLPLPCLKKASAGMGFVNVLPDEDGIVRRMPPKLNDCWALGLELAFRALGIEDQALEFIPNKSLTLRPKNGEMISIPLDSDNRILLNQAGNTMDWRWLHFVQIIKAFMEDQKGGKPSVDLSFLKGKIVLVGSTHAGMPDIIETPFGKSSYGVELHASIINSVLQRNFLRPLSARTDIIIYFAIIFGTVLVLRRYHALKGGLVSAAIFLAFIWIAYVLFSKFHIWIKVVKPIFGLLGVYLTGLIYYFIKVERKEREVRKAFRHYVSPAVVSEIIKEPEKLKLGGDTKELTILFSDIRGFTTFSEEVSPDLLGEMLNEYFSSMTSSIFAHGGTLDKFIGDAIMALYGAPLGLPDHPLKGCLSALSMFSNLKQLNAKWGGEGKDPFDIGIGLNTGTVKVGNFGSRERFNYTVIGPDVNLASRLEALTKSYGVDIIISDSTYKRVGQKMLCRPLDVVYVKGSKRATEIFELIGEKGDLPRETKEKVQTFRTCLDLFYERRWQETQQSLVEFLDRFPNDRPAQIFQERARRFMKNPPPDDWDGVFAKTTVE
jgi:adenylate cyclase